MLLRSALIGLVSAMSACVLPIAPDFQDPPSENFAPTFVDTEPPAGSIVTVGSTTTFNLILQDPNVDDDLYVRWISDYPPFTNATSVMADYKVDHSPTGQLLTAPPFQPDCILNHIAPGAMHQLYVVVADRAFLAPGSPPDVEKLPPDAKKDSRSWIIDLDCSVLAP